MNRRKVSIPKPCSYGWDKMSVTKDNTGRHCKACDKIVVDFTVMTTEELQNFLLNYQGAKTCGRFKTIDTAIETTWFQKRLLNFHNYIDRNWNTTVLKAMTLFTITTLLTLTGCTTNTVGEIAPNVNGTRDSIAVDSMAKSKIALEKDSVNNTNTKKE